MQEIVRIAENLYNVSKEQVKERNKNLISCVETCLIVSKLLALLYGGAIFLFLISPGYTYLFQDELTLPIAISFPYIDEQTLQGYVITLSVHLFFLVYALVGHTAFDMLFMTYVYHFKAFTGENHLRTN